MAHTHPVKDMDKHFIIDPITRTITNAESKKTLLMQNDHNSEQFSFEIPCQVEGHDIMKCNRVEIHYSNVDSTKRNSSLGVYSVKDMHLSEDGTKVIFTWLVSEHATIHPGSLSFLILFACIENDEVVYRWNTGINTSIAIAKGMYNGDFIVESYPDILAQWYNDLDEWRTAHDTELNQAKQECHDAANDVRDAADVATTAAQEATAAANAANEAANAINTSTVIEYANQAKNSASSAASSANTAASAAAVAASSANRVEEIAGSLENVVTDAELETAIGGVRTEIGNLETDMDELAQDIYAKARKVYATATIGTSWSGSGPYTQSVEVAGLLESDTPIVDLIANTDPTIAESEIAAWASIYRIDTADGRLTVYASDPTTQAISIQILGVR